MPKEDKYAGIVESLTQAQNAVRPMLTCNNVTTERIANGINVLTQTLIDASQAKFLFLQLTKSTVAIGSCVLDINGQQDINDTDCLPIPEIDSPETFKLGIIVLQLLFALNPRKDPGIQDFLEPLNLATGWRQRLNRSPMALINKLKNYYLQAEPDTQLELLDLIPENLAYIRKKLQAENALNAETVKFSRVKPRFHANTVFFQYKVVTKSLTRINTILKDGIKLITCRSFANLNTDRLDHTKINLVRDRDKNYRLYWLDRTCNIASVSFPSQLAKAVFPEETDDSARVISGIERTSPVYDEVKRLISTNIYIQTEDRDKVDSALAITPAQQANHGDAEQLVRLNPVAAHIYNATMHRLTQYMNPGTAEFLTTFGLRTLTNIHQVIASPPDEDGIDTTTSSEESLPTPTEQLGEFLEEIEKINALIQELFEYINTNKSCINNYLQAVQDEITEFTESDSPNKHIYFSLTNSHDVPEEQYFQNYKSLEKIVLINTEIDQAIAKLPEINSANLPRELESIPRHNIQRLHQQQEMLIAEAQSLEEAKALALQRKQELYAAIIKSPPLTINNQIFTNTSEIPPWYLRALTYKVLPYISAFIFALALAATIICAGLMANSPAFIVFSLKTLNNIVTPLCITGIALGVTAAVVSGTGLVSACMFSNLRDNPDKLINAHAPTINTL